LIGTDRFVDTAGALDIPLMAVTCAHEIGHYLGLYHTSEASGQASDPIPDTDDDDVDNIMYPSGGTNRRIFSQDQGRIMRRHPLCDPE
jgi:hypothetical protein